MTEKTLFVSNFTKTSNIFGNPWYPHKYPKPDDIVIGCVDGVDDTGIRVLLLDYNFIEGFMPLQELSSRKMYSIKKMFKEGQIKPLLVLTVDEEKGYIDLSNKYIDMAHDDIVRLEKYSYLIKIMYHWLIRMTGNFSTKLDPDDWKKVMEATLWTQSKSKLYDIFLDIKMGEESVSNAFPNLLQVNTSFTINNESVDLLKEIICDTIVYEIELKLKINLKVFSSNAVTVIKTILSRILESVSLEYPDFKLGSMAPPEYEFVLRSNSKKSTLKLFDDIDETVESIVRDYNDVVFTFDKEVKEFTDKTY